jgi:hypothetical protein
VTAATENRLRVARDQAADKKMPSSRPNREVAVSRGGKRERGRTGDRARLLATAVIA